MAIGFLERLQLLESHLIPSLWCYGYKPSDKQTPHSMEPWACRVTEYHIKLPQLPNTNLLSSWLEFHCQMASILNQSSYDSVHINAIKNLDNLHITLFYMTLYTAHCTTRYQITKLYFLDPADMLHLLPFSRNLSSAFKKDPRLCIDILMQVINKL